MECHVRISKYFKIRQLYFAYLDKISHDCNNGYSLPNAISWPSLSTFILTFFCQFSMRNVAWLKGNKHAAVFYDQPKFVNFFIQGQQMSQQFVFNLVFNEDSKMGSAIFGTICILKFI